MSASILSSLSFFVNLYYNFPIQHWLQKTGTNIYFYFTTPTNINIIEPKEFGVVKVTANRSEVYCDMFNAMNSLLQTELIVSPIKV